MTTQKFIQVRIKDTVNGTEFNDAIYYTEDEYNALTQDKIDAQAQARVDK